MIANKRAQINIVYSQLHATLAISGAAMKMMMTSMSQKKETDNCIIAWMSIELWTIISHSKSQTSETVHWWRCKHADLCHYL